MSRGEEDRRGADGHAPAPEDAAARGDAADAERQARLAARRYFRAAPAYRIQFEDDGGVSLRRKRYSYWGDVDPAAATQWAVLSYHRDLESAERRLRHITSPPPHYDERGSLVPAPRRPREEDWGVPEDDDEDEA